MNKDEIHKSNDNGGFKKTEHTSDNLLNIQCFYDAVNYLHFSNSYIFNQSEYKLRKKTNNLFIIPEQKEETPDNSNNDNSISDAQICSSENVRRTNLSR
jgi:hypothetical protein